MSKRLNADIVYTTTVIEKSVALVVNKDKLFVEIEKEVDPATQKELKTWST